VCVSCEFYVSSVSVSCVFRVCRVCFVCVSSVFHVSEVYFRVRLVGVWYVFGMC